MLIFFEKYQQINLEIFKSANMSKYSVVMIRHGESEWNQKNLFCGWFDSDLSDAGRAEAEAAGKALKGMLLHHHHTEYHTRYNTWLAN